ncbi:unnamed protein product [Heterobilharzia americana]|nr:unnamed protein product [Heterobilharzia americana]
MACATLTMGLRDRMLRNYIKDPHSLSEDDHLKGNGPGSLVDRMVAYTSDQAHSSVSRAFRIAMVNSRIIKSKRCGRRLVFDPVDLRRAIEKDLEKGFIPLMCVATMGTTSTCEFEDLQGIGQVCNDYGIWFHVDAAYGGIALLCPELRHLSRGIELADSVNINAHKMMMVNVDSSPLWLSDHRVLTEAFEANPLYLHHAYGGMPDYRHVELAKHFERLLTEDGRFHITNDVQFGLVCFQLKNDNSLTVALHDELMKKGDIFLVLGSTEISGEEGDEAVEAVSTEIVFLRFVCIHGTTMDDVEFAYERISAAASYILEGNDEGNGGVVTKGTR